MKKLALLIIYNHRYDRNIPILDEMYQRRFSHVYHVVPFYDGRQNNVIPVFESSFFFEGYISQALTRLDDSYTHFFVIADDMMLNPLLNEENLWDVMGLTDTDCYIDKLIDLQNVRETWAHMKDALRYDPAIKGVEVQSIIPNPDIVESRLKSYGITHGKLPLRHFLKHPKLALTFNRVPRYPMCGGYADIFLFTSKERKQIQSMFGAFAATNLFVECAVPTTLVTVCDSLKFSNNIKLKPGALWRERITEFPKQYDYDLSRLFAEWPRETLYIHPIKLSKWSK